MRAPRTRLRWAISALFMGALVAEVSTAQAGETDQKAMAQTLFEQARDLVRQGEFAAACPKLAQSLRLDPGTGTMLWLADCYEHTSQTASAWAVFKEAAASAALQGDPREKIARRRAADLEPRLTKLVIVLQPAAKVPGLEVHRDGAVIGDMEVGLPSPVDPGKHTIRATAIGHAEWSIDLDVPARPETVVVEVPRLTPSAPVVAAPVLAATSAPAPIAVRSSWSAMRVSGVVLAGAGVAAIGTGTFLGLSAKSTYADSNRDGHCTPTNVCDETGKQHRSAAGALATGATVAFGAGLAALAGGAILYFTAPNESKPATVVIPVVGATEAGVFLHRRF
jgi:hypothetical protein